MVIGAHFENPSMEQKVVSKFNQPAYVARVARACPPDSRDVSLVALADQEWCLIQFENTAVEQTKHHPHGGPPTGGRLVLPSAVARKLALGVLALTDGVQAGDFVFEYDERG